jgi:hypothetical protein
MDFHRLLFVFLFGILGFAERVFCYIFFSISANGMNRQISVESDALLLLMNGIDRIIQLCMHRNTEL